MVLVVGAQRFANVSKLFDPINSLQYESLKNCTTPPAQLSVSVCGDQKK